MTESHLAEDNRIVGPGITRDLEYDGDTGTATFFLGADTLVLQMPFRSAHLIADALRRRYEEGYRDGISRARRHMEILEKYA